MSRAYSDIAFTPAVRAMQTRMGTRAGYASLDHNEDRRDALTEDEAEFIHARDGFYQATVSESGWPYVQFRGGPAGFLKVLDDKTIGYAEFRGNVQYISVGNLQGNDRVSIILMDYANKRRLKILGRVRLVSDRDDPALVARLELPHYRARVERAVVITVEAYDWNCPQHITPRFTEAEIEEGVAPLHAEIARLQQALGQAEVAHASQSMGDGLLALRITGIRQLTPRVRAYELRAPDGAVLPAVQAGAHIDVPIRLKNGLPSTRRFSISSNPNRRDAYEIAVLREDTGSGGSAAVHADYRLGMTLHCRPPRQRLPVARRRSPRRADRWRHRHHSDQGHGAAIAGPRPARRVALRGAVARGGPLPRSLAARVRRRRMHLRHRPATAPGCATPHRAGRRRLGVLRLRPRAADRCGARRGTGRRRGWRADPLRALRRRVRHGFRSCGHRDAQAQRQAHRRATRAEHPGRRRSRWRGGAVRLPRRHLWHLPGQGAWRRARAP